MSTTPARPSNELTDPAFWDTFWGKGREDRPLRPFYFDALIEGLEYSTEKTAIELGCTPGDNLVHVHRMLGYKVSGIDFSESVERVPAWLRKNGVEEAEIFRGDILTFPFKKRYDLVFSFGLVEHFVDPAPMLARHAELLAPGGWLLITVPNFRYFHYVARLIADYELLMKHETVLMSPRRMRKYVSRLDVDIVRCEYFEDFLFWNQNPRRDRLSMLKKRFVLKLAAWIRKAYEHKPLKGRTSAFFSPWVAVLARKKPA